VGPGFRPISRRFSGAIAHGTVVMGSPEKALAFLGKGAAALPSEAFAACCKTSYQGRAVTCV